jgi:hypothetical protein
MIGNPSQRRDKMPRLIILALVLLALRAGAVVPAQAGSNGRKGTEGAPELTIAVGARGSALGGAVVGDASGVEAMFWNPAGLGTLTKTETMFSHTQYFADMTLNYAAVASKLGDFGVLGFSAKVLSVGDIIVTTESAPEGTGEIAQPTFTVLGLTWAKQFTDRVLFGASGNLVSERVINQSATGMAFDFGVQYVTDWRGLKLGMVMKNFGSGMTYSGPGSELSLLPPDQDPSGQPRIFTSETSSFELPSFFTMGGSCDLYSVPQYRITALGALQNNNFQGNALRAGLEWRYRDQFALRGSYYGSFVGTTNANTAVDESRFQGGDDLYTGLALGGGVNLRVGDTSRMGVDVTWRPVRNGYFDDIIDIGLKLSF